MKLKITRRNKRKLKRFFGRVLVAMIIAFMVFLITVIFIPFPFAICGAMTSFFHCFFDIK